jgi:MFS transporter, SET family, sugar efflux transporter
MPAPGRLGFVREKPDLKNAIWLSFVLGLAYAFVAPFLSLFGTEEVGMSPLEFGVFMTLTSFSAIVVSTVLARWSDVRWPRKTVLLLGATGSALGYAGYAVLRDWPLLLVAGCVLLGVGSGTFGQLFAYTRDVVEHDDELKPEAPFVMNVVRLSFAFAWTVGPALSAWMMQLVDFRGTFLFAAGLFALFGLMVARLVRQRPPRAEARARAAALPLSVALRHPVVLTYFLAFCLSHGCTTMGMMNLPLYLTRSLHGGTHSVGIAYSLAPVFELPFMFYVGSLALRVSHALIIRAAVGVAIVYYLGLTFAPSPVVVYFLQILSAAVVAVMSGLAITFFQDFMPGQPGTATNLYSNAQRVGSTLGYLTFGSVANALGYRAVFFVCAAACVLALALLASVRRSKLEFA